MDQQMPVLCSYFSYHVRPTSESQLIQTVSHYSVGFEYRFGNNHLLSSMLTLRPIVVLSSQSIIFNS